MTPSTPLTISEEAREAAANEYVNNEEAKRLHQIALYGSASEVQSLQHARATMKDLGYFTQLAINQATAKLEEDKSKLYLEMKSWKAVAEVREKEVHSLIAKRDTLEERVRELERVVKAAYRLRFYAYIDWAKSGGLNQCGHGRAEGVHCPVCDEILLEGEGKTLP